jgi:hypothetical protein
MALATRADILKFMGRGLGMVQGNNNASTSSGTSAAAGSGFFSASLGLNLVGTTYPSPLVGFPLPPGLPNELFGTCIGVSTNSSTKPCYLCRFYLIGTLNMAATGDQFTHDAATFPLTRKELGQSAQPVSLIPMVHITTATATTAPIFRLRTVAGAAGYTDQDGNSVIGTVTMTMPAAATNQHSCYIIRLEYQDSGIRDISNIEVTTAGSAGAANIWGVELLMPAPMPLGGSGYIYDAVYGGLGMCDLAPAVATSGTVTSYLGMILFATSASSNSLYLNAVLNGT